MDLRLRTLPTADLTGAERAELREFLDAAFPAGFTDEHWGHALGGLHVLALGDGGLVGHAAVIGRQLMVGELTLRTGYVEAVAVAATARRQGVATAVMTEAERLIEGSAELGALAASEDGVALYEARRWTRWRGSLCALSPHGRIAGDASRVYVLPTAATPGSLDPDLPLTCDWRRGSLW